MRFVRPPVLIERGKKHFPQIRQRDDGADVVFTPARDPIARSPTPSLQGSVKKNSGTAPRPSADHEQMLPELAGSVVERRDAREICSSANHLFIEIAAQAVRIESRTNLLFSFEKMALRDAVKSPAGARSFAHGLYDFLHGTGDAEKKFERWCGTIAAFAAKTDARPDLAADDHLRFHRAARPTHFPQTECHQDRGAELRLRI
jgi:hypothetical protein